MTDLVFRVSAAISTGAILIAPGWSVGPFKLAASPEVTFACLDARGAPVEVWEEHNEIVLTTWGLDHEVRRERDWSAFGAARAFVTRPRGEIAARVALKDLELARALGRNVGVDPGPPYSAPSRSFAEHARSCRAIRCRICAGRVRA